MRKETVKLAGVEFTFDELSKALASGNRYLAKFRTLYVIINDSHGLTYARPIYKERGALPLVARGRHSLVDASTANSYIGFELCLP
jgi:hypothetical protein